jgi:hypothetical protein
VHAPTLERLAREHGLVGGRRAGLHQLYAELAAPGDGGAAARAAAEEMGLEHGKPADWAAEWQALHLFSHYEFERERPKFAHHAEDSNAHPPPLAQMDPTGKFDYKRQAVRL